MEVAGRQCGETELIEKVAPCSSHHATSADHALRGSTTAGSGGSTILNAPTVTFANAVTQVGMPQVAADLGDGKSGFISGFAAKGGGRLR